ncbi:MAG TPA: hypothetical protein VFK45_07855, partial [Gammaproteobacteria bacterium]|nr:hypothetical protein [Gammaproteobacteria bacterium]
WQIPLEGRSNLPDFSSLRWSSFSGGGHYAPPVYLAHRRWHLRQVSTTSTVLPSSPNRLTVVYHYDSSGALSKVTNSDGSIYWQALETNARGQHVGVRLGNGVMTANVYSPSTGALMGRSSGIGLGTGVQAITYTYDTLGNLTSRTDANQGLTEKFTYDGLIFTAPSIRRDAQPTHGGKITLDFTMNAVHPVKAPASPQPCHAGRLE